ncbi:MAG: hypothetical protein H8D45_18795 [Bacteroidetes bacterium]|nr:hypothetical protein [Bacteroidota bacterium]
MFSVVQLEKILIDFLNESVALLHELNVKGQFKWYHEPCFERTKEGGRRLTVRKRKKYSFNFISCEKDIRDIESCKILEEQISLLSNSIDSKRKIKKLSLSEYISNRSYPLEILYTALNKQRKIPQLSKINCQNIVRGLDEILIEKKVSVINIALLSRDLVFWRSKRLDDNTTFKFLTLKELSDLFNKASLAINFSGVRDWLDNWAIVAYEKVPLHDFLNYLYDSTRRLREIILALRLCEDTFIIDRLIMSRLQYETGLLKHFEGYRYTRSLRNICLDIHTLPQVSLPQLKKIRESLSLIDSSDQLLNPLLRRFLNALESRRIEDSLLDLIILIEGLLVPEGGGSIAYKFAMRATAICSQYRISMENISKNDYFQWFKLLYSIRSKLVHGSEKRVRKKVSYFMQEYNYSSISDVFRSAFAVAKKILNIYLSKRWYNIKDDGERAKKIDEIVLERIQKKPYRKRDESA